IIRDGYHIRGTVRYRYDGDPPGGSEARGHVPKCITPPAGASTQKAPAGGRGFPVVRDTGIEPVTSSVSGKRSPAELIARVLRPDESGRRGGDGNRTRVDGFAGR